MSADSLRILAFGDSLTAGFMLEAGDAFPAKLEKALRVRGHEVEIVNAGVSGDTTADGLARIGQILGRPYDRAIVEFGANDALMGVDPRRVCANLDAILGTLRARGIGLFLAGMLAPDDMGVAYGRAFAAVYPALRDKYGIPLYPFFLEGVLGNPDMTFYDGLHPNSRGVDTMVTGILPAVERWLGAPSPVGGGGQP